MNKPEVSQNTRLRDASYYILLDLTLTFIENHGGNINKISVFGQDSNPTTWKMAQMNLAIRGIEADLGKFNTDTFFNDCHLRQITPTLPDSNT